LLEFIGKELSPVSYQRGREHGDVLPLVRDSFDEPRPLAHRRIAMKPLTGSLAAVFFLSPLLFANAQAQDSETRVKMKDLPKPVQKTVKEQSKGASVRGLSKETDQGKTYYEVELKVKGHTKDVLIDETGAVVETEEEVAIASLPPAVKAEFEKHAANGKIQMVESITKDGAVVAYEAHIKVGEKFLEVKVGPDGQLIETETDQDDDDAKEEAARQKASKKSKKP
jgi:uncharacterized membrane protein YkoI